METKYDFAKKIIVALDVEGREKALSLVRRLDRAEIFKVGLKLFTAEGPVFLREVMGLGKKIFLDLKLHDIPNTVAGAVKMGIKNGAYMLTLHASGGREMMTRAAEAAREAVAAGKTKPLLLAVTVLTSLKDEDLKEIGITSETRRQVLRLANLARETGMDGVVCSPQEIDFIRKELRKDFLVVTPGIRPSWTAAHDQKRIMTPSQAIEKGADYLVIGRPIIEAPSPEEAFFKICEELNRAVDSSYRKNGP